MVHMANISRKDSKGRKLRDGETERKDGRYMYRYTNKKTGKRQSVYAKDLAELREKEKTISMDVFEGILTDSSIKKLTLNAMFERYMATRQISETTKISYMSAWNNQVRNSIGACKVVSLVNSDIRSFYSQMATSGYSHGMIQLVHNLLNPTFEMAVNDGIIRRNPVKGALSNYGRAKEESIALTVLQQKQLMEFAKNSNYYNVYVPMLTIMLGTGMRCGELVGLTWDDVDMEKKEININHQLVYKNYGDGCKFHIHSPKTDSGIRIIPMSQKVYEAFMEQKRLNILLGKNENVKVENYTGFVFVTRNDRPFIPTSVNKVLYKIVNAHNRMEHIQEEEKLPSISAHTMRHTFCTRMSENGMDIKVLQYLMGHSNINITMQIYNHVTDIQRIEREMAKMKLLTMDL